MSKYQLGAQLLATSLNIINNIGGSDDYWQVIDY